MIRIEQTYTCAHKKPGDPVIIKTCGHTVSAGGRVCYCTGKPVPMTESVTTWEPEVERMSQ